MLQVPATNGRPASNTDYSRQALERVLRRADAWTEFCVRASSVILGQCDLVQARHISSCRGQEKSRGWVGPKKGPCSFLLKADEEGCTTGADFRTCTAPGTLTNNFNNDSVPELVFKECNHKQ